MNSQRKKGKNQDDNRPIIGKSEFASDYYSEKKFWNLYQRLINSNSAAYLELIEAGYVPGVPGASKKITPLQMDVFFKYLGH